MKFITHLVLAGNALKSLCLCGVLRYIYSYNIDKNIHDIAATSKTLPNFEKMWNELVNL